MKDEDGGILGREVGIGMELVIEMYVSMVGGQMLMLFFFLIKKQKNIHALNKAIDRWNHTQKLNMIVWVWGKTGTSFSLI